MSRYTAKRGTQTLAYGYDRPIGEYFYQIYDENFEDNEMDGLVADVGTRMTGLSKADFIAKLQHFGVDENHIQLASLDLEF